MYPTYKKTYYPDPEEVSFYKIIGKLSVAVSKFSYNKTTEYSFFKVENTKLITSMMVDSTKEEYEAAYKEMIEFMEKNK